MQKIRVGIIGVHPTHGWAIMAHIPALRRLEGFEIIAVSARLPDNAKAVADAIGAPFHFSDQNDLVRLPEVDLVVVSVKVPAHKELVTAALMAGKSVYCEWPLGNGLDETVALTALAKTQNVHGFIGLQSRGSPTIRYIRDVIAAGEIGEVLSTSITMSSNLGIETIPDEYAYLYDKSNGSNMLTVSVGHTLDAACFCLGEFADLIASTAVQRKTIRAVPSQRMVEATSPDQIIVGGRLESGAMLSLHSRGGEIAGDKLRWEIQGTKKNLLVTSNSFYTAASELILHESTATHPAYQNVAIPAAYTLVPQSAARAAPVAIAHTHLAYNYDVSFNVMQTYKLLESDRQHGTRLCPDFQDAVLRHRMLAAIEASNTTGQRQSF